MTGELVTITDALLLGGRWGEAAVAAVLACVETACVAAEAGR